MDRREFLATGATLAIATAGGCTGCAKAPSASLRMEPITDAEIAEEVTYEVPENPERHRLVSEAVDTETATVEGTEPPVPADRPFVYGGSVYELSYEVTDSKPVTIFHFTLDPVEESVPDSESIRFEDLPAVDKEAFAARGWDDVTTLGFGSSLRYPDAEIGDSVLVPESEYSVVVWDADTRGRFEVDGSHSTRLKTYRYESEQVHPSAEEYGREIRERYEFTLSEVTKPERDILAEAIEGEGSYSIPADESPPDALWKLAKRFRPHGEIRYVWEDGGDGTAGESQRIDGTYLVRYDGEVYWTRIQVAREFTTTAEK